MSWGFEADAEASFGLLERKQVLSITTSVSDDKQDIQSPISSRCSSRVFVCVVDMAATLTTR